MSWGVGAEAIDAYIDQGANQLAPPDLDDDNVEYLIAFHRLSPSRQIGFAVGAIPVTEIRAYCDLFGIEEVETFFCLIRALDSAYVECMAKKGKEK